MNIAYLKETTTRWQTDGDTDAAIIRIPNTGAADAQYVLPNPLGRVPVEVVLIKKSVACDVYVDSATIQTLVIKFSAANADVNLRIR
jgi:hypothetical protein